MVSVPEGLVESLDRVARKLRGAVALVSGRTIDEIDRLFAPLRLRASGVHGAEIRIQSGETIRIAPTAIELPTSLRTELSLALGQIPGVLIEDKGHCHGAPGLRRSRWPGSRTRMNKISYSGYRFPPEIIQQAIWLYLRFTLSLRDVEDLLAERGVAVSYETVRRWVNHFGPMIAADLRKRRLKPHTTWHLDEVYLKIDGRMVYLWRAVDAEGEVLDVLVQSKRNKHAALKLMRKLLKKYVPERLVTDDLRSYSAAVRELRIERRHERGRWKNNRAENSHQPTRRRERKMQRFKSPGFSPEVSFHPRRRLQHLQRPTPSHLRPNAPRASRCRDDHVADCSRSGLTIPEVPTLRARGMAT